MNILIFLLILGVLVLVHEFGHFIVAKKSGIRVDEFAIGFPPRLFKWKRGETTYSLNLLPLGGYVKIFGEDAMNVKKDDPDYKRSFVHKPRYIQAMVLVAGVIGNALLAWILFAMAIMIGLPTPSGYAGARALENQQVIVTDVLSNSPASEARILQGDVIESIAYKGDVVYPKTMDEVKEQIGRHADHEISISIKRKSESIQVVATPKTAVGSDRALLGIGLAQTGLLKLPFFSAIVESGKVTIYLIGATAIGLWDLVHNAIAGVADFSQIAGPVGIVPMVGEAREVGFTYLLQFAAMISVNLAVINLLPFPALDGGRLLFTIIESIIRRPIKPIIAGYANLIGFAILMLLMVAVTYHDILKLIHS